MKIDYEINHTKKSLTQLTSYEFLSNNFVTINNDFGSFNSLKLFNITTILSFYDLNDHIVNKKAIFYSTNGLTINNINNLYFIDQNSNFEIIYF